MKTKLLSVILALVILVTVVTCFAVNAAADTVTVTYSIFDATIPFKNIVDCQRTTYTTVGEMQQLNGFDYVYSADRRVLGTFNDVLHCGNDLFQNAPAGQKQTILRKKRQKGNKL